MIDKKVQILSKTVSSKQQGGVSSSVSGGSSSVVYNNIDLLSLDAIAEPSEHNAFSALRALYEQKKEIENRLIKSEDEKEADDSTFYTSLRTLKEINNSIKNLYDIFLRKDQPDKTEHLLQLLGGAEFGEYINSLVAGKGAAIDKDGKAQVESLEVRSYLKVLELIYNRLSATEGDIVFTESGLIEKVEKIDESTYRLTFRKRWDNDFIAFHEGDVLRGIVNNLTAGGEYYTSWSRVLNVNTSSNTATVVVYPDDEAPANKNFAPTEKMVVHRWGNALNKQRQSTWYLSTTEGRIVYLSDVTKPILEDHNYAAFFGKPIALKVLEGKPINPDQPYLYIRGLFVQDFFEIDYNGAPLIRERDNGLWESGKEYTDGREKPHLQDAVWHHGVKWKAVVEKATEVPKWNSTHWALAGGDTRIKLEIESSNGWFFYPDQVDTIFSVTVYRGDEDITSMILPEDWQWTRDTGNINADNAWAIKHKNDTHTLHLGNEDVGVDFSSQKRVKFICTVFIRYGEEVLERKVEIKI